MGTDLTYPPDAHSRLFAEGLIGASGNLLLFPKTYKSNSMKLDTKKTCIQNGELLCRAGEKENCKRYERHIITGVIGLHLMPRQIR
jgi:hypothetical protein